MLGCQPLNLDNELTLYIHDATRFISVLIISISQSAPHVYLSALPFAPEESHVARKFRLRFPNTFVVAQRKPSQWPMAVFTAEHHQYPVNDVAFSPDKSTFFSRSGDTVCICDSETGHCISGPFKMPECKYRSQAHFSPTGSHILFKCRSYAVVWDIEAGEEQFRVKGSDFAFIHHDGRIASADWFDEDGNLYNSEGGNLDDSEDKGAMRILVKSWDASNGALICNRLLDVNDVGAAKFSPDGHFLAIAKRSESIIELWDLEDSKDLRRFTYPHGKLEFLRFSPTSDTLMVRSREEPRQIYLWRLDTQEMASFSHKSYGVPHVIHLPLANYLFIEGPSTVDIWDVSATGSKMVWEIKRASTSNVNSIYPSCDGHRLLVGYEDGSVRMWNLDLESLAINQADTTDTRYNSDERQVIRISPSGKMVATRPKPWLLYKVKFLDTTTGRVVARIKGQHSGQHFTEIAFSPDEEQVAFLTESLVTICNIMRPKKRVTFNPWPRENVAFGRVAFQTCEDPETKRLGRIRFTR